LQPSDQRHRVCGNVIDHVLLMCNKPYCT
jgi:hypothetical protein